MTIITNAEEFHWHCCAIDLEHRHHHVHQGRPSHYPCRVVSSTISPAALGTSARICTHTFEYQETRTCRQCGDKRLCWVRPLFPEASS